MNDYYVYGYSDPVGTDPYFYIGKGVGRRAYRHLDASYRNRETHFYNKLNKMLLNGLPPIITLIEVKLTKQEAINIEIELIARYGRLDLGTGCLCNHTTGGEGGLGAITGHKHSFETILKLQESNSNRSKETNDRLRQTHVKTQGRPVNAISLTTGEIVLSFDCINAVRSKGIDPSSVCRVLSGRQQSSGGYFWKYA